VRLHDFPTLFHRHPFFFLACWNTKKKLLTRKSWGLLGFPAFLQSSRAPLALSLSFDSIEMLMSQRPDQHEPTFQKETQKERKTGQCSGPESNSGRPVGHPVETF